MSSDNFFSRFLGFHRDETASLLEQFDQLSLTRKWKTDGKVYRKNRAELFAQEIDSVYGASGKLQGWIDLCVDLKIEPVPTSITQCKKAIKSVHVNIYDFLDARDSGKEVNRFSSVKALKTYSKSNNKVFPLRVAKGDGYLKALLKKLA